MMQNPQRILARCPRTGRWLETGLVVPDDVFERLESLESSVFCPSCGDIHRWTRDSAALDGELPVEGEGTTSAL